MHPDHRYLCTLLALTGVLGCSAAGSHGPAPAQTPEPVAAGETVEPMADGGAGVVSDSAADAMLLEFLASESLNQPRDETPVRTVTWDIAVEPFVSHSQVKRYLDFFQEQARDRFAIWLTRLPQYESMIRGAMEANNVPQDMVYLALIESGYSNSAVSRSRAVGMWQFMAGTGRQYGLRIDYWVDERRDPFKATDAAARHLADLRDRFGSIFLAAAAYNAGAGRVSRGLRRLPADLRDSLEMADSTFFHLANTRYLVRETREYVPKLIAAALIAKEPERYGFEPLGPAEPWQFDTLRVPDATGLDVVARLADTSLAAIRFLNPQFVRLATPPKEKALLRIPAGSGEQVLERYAELPASERVTFMIHKVRQGETMGHIARRYGVSTRDLSMANPKVKPRSMQIGTQLVIPTGGIPSPEVVTAMTRNPNTPSSRWHTVRRGESLWTISRRYGVSTKQIKRWNGLRSDLIKPGQTLRVRPA